MLLLEMLAERKILEAIQRGELDDLPGQGAPLNLDQDPLVPGDLRVAYRILKNAGLVPPELEAHREIHALEQLVRHMEPGPERVCALRKLQWLDTRLAESRRDDTRLRVDATYSAKLLERLSGD
jgi:Domain of unknown function (DUF1992)